MTDSAEIAAQLAADGQMFTLSRTTPGAYDALSGAVDSPVIQTWQISGIMGNLNSIVRPGSSVEAGTLVKAGDKAATLAADKEAPIPSDTLTDAAGVKWSVISVDTIAPAGVALLHKCHVRR